MASSARVEREDQEIDQVGHGLEEGAQPGWRAMSGRSAAALRLWRHARRDWTATMTAAKRAAMGNFF